MLDKTDEFSFVLKPSKLKDAGVGVFATHDIRSGTKLALNKEGGEHRIMNAADVPEALQHFSIALEDGRCKVPLAFNHLWIVWYLNHSDIAAAKLNLHDGAYYACKDIKAGEEILINYNAPEEPRMLKKDYYNK